MRHAPDIKATPEAPTWGKHEKGPAGMEPLAPSPNIPMERAGASSCPLATKSCRFESNVI